MDGGEKSKPASLLPSGLVALAGLASYLLGACHAGRVKRYESLEAMCKAIVKDCLDAEQ